MILDYLPIAMSFFSLLVVWGLISWINRQPKGSEGMQKIAAAIKEGSNAFVARQYKTIGWITIFLAILFFVWEGFILYKEYIFG